MLLADDSAAVQKVIELTFADEGMEVVSVGDGQSALERLEHVVPDIVLADAFMPGLSGYELCRSMKGDDRFAQIPVMLLVSSFAPFDEVEARRAGADDIMTKPFSSIRQLVSRVDSLLSGKRTAADTEAEQLREEARTLEFDAPPIPVEVEPSAPSVTVLVEAAQMDSAQTHEPIGGACAPDIEFQTADTAQLEAIRDTDLTADTIEMETPFAEVSAGGPPSEAVATEAVFEYQNPNNMTETVTPPRFTDSLLDLDQADFTTGIDDELILDLDFEMPLDVHDESSIEESEAEVAGEPSVEAEIVSSAWMDEAPAPVEKEAAEIGKPQAPVQPETSLPMTTQTEVSPQVIDAIARRVIEQMSDKVVREIAWEVVPELSELMIKRKLDQR